MHFPYMYSPTSVQCSTWDEANDWINGGQNRRSHRLMKSKIRKLTRAATRIGENDDIIFWLWETPIITYHRDGTFTLFHDGITTQTTIWDMRRHSPVQLVGVPGTQVEKWNGFRDSKQHWCSEWEIAHETDPLTPPRLWKCRMCHGTGQSEPWVCYPHSRYEMNDTTGLYVRVGIEPCPHGTLFDHTQTYCRQCDGSGRFDYGSKPIHTPFEASDRIHIDATGRPIHSIEEWASLIARVRKTRQRLTA